MGKLFRNKIDIEKGKIYSLNDETREIGSINEDGYLKCKCYDKYGNRYDLIHQVIFAEYHSYPKNEWPRDSNGRIYDVDHINRIRDDNRILNLRLLPHAINNATEGTRASRSKAMSGEKNSMYGVSIPKEKGGKYANAVLVFKGDELIGEFVSENEAARQLNLQQSNIGKCCKGLISQTGGLQFKYKKEDNN